MGGAKSKFEKTDWITANGGLSGQEQDQTIDGSPPTTSYGIYYLTKTKLNQREFVVTDLDNNLLYSTKLVPGTLSFFDVYGPGIDDCRLRVQVDLSRRFWVIYRCGWPVFEGQFADREATDKFANDRRESGDDLSSTPFLFRRACIAVSWTRYMAVAMQYGRPDYIDVTKTSELMDGSRAAPMRKRGSEGSLVVPLKQQQRRLRENSDDTKDGGEEKKADEERIQSSQQEQELVVASRNCHREGEGNPSEEAAVENDAQHQPTKLVFDASMELASSLHGGSAASSSGPDEPEENQPITEVVTAWVQNQVQYIKDNKRKKLMTDPLEGILHLDKPLLLCQEIYDKIIGNHQTCVLSREHAIELLREDLEQHKNDGETDGYYYPFLADQDGIFAQIEGLRRLEEEEKKAKEEAKNNPQSKQVVVQVEEQVVSEEQSFAQENAQSDDQEGDDKSTKAKRETADKEPGEKETRSDPKTNQKEVRPTIKAETAPSKKHQSTWLSWIGKHDENEQSEQNGESETTANAAEGNESQPSSSAEDDLVAYWLWENTWQKHQMKMHLAAGSDLALHVVMAIIVNQVRYERNAIAMSI